MNARSLSHDEFIEKAQDDLVAAALGPDLIQVDLSPGSAAGAMAVDFLRVLEEGNLRKGLARRVLQLLMQLADESGYALEVIPHSFDGPMSDAQLRAWYEKNGFRSAGSPDTPNLMRRDPQA